MYVISMAAVHSAACRNLEGNKLTGTLPEQLFRSHPMLRNLEVTALQPQLIKLKCVAFATV